jgi:hypothetical protein
MKKTISLRMIAIFLVLLFWLQNKLISEQTQMLQVKIKQQEKILIQNYKLQGKGFYLLHFFTQYSYDKNVLSETLLSSIQLAWKGKIAFLKVSETIEMVANEKIISKKVPLHLVFENQKTKDLLYQKFVVQDLDVEVEGKEKILSDLVGINSDLIMFKDVSDQSLNEFKVRLKQNDTYILPISNYVFQLRKNTTQKVFSLLDIQVSPNYDVQIYPQKVSCKISGDFEDIHQIQKKSIMPYIIWDMKAEFAEIAFKKPQQVQIIDYTPKKVRIIKK